MTAEEYTIERLVNIERENDTLRGLKERLEKDYDILVDSADRLQSINRNLRQKLDDVKQIVISTLEHESDLSSDIMLYKEDVHDLIEILDIKIDKEVLDEVPED